MGYSWAPKKRAAHSCAPVIELFTLSPYSPQDKVAFYIQPAGSNPWGTLMLQVMPWHHQNYARAHANN